ncbi:MAG: M14 family metallopeptidase [Isosphaeraceae bacterium]
MIELYSFLLAVALNPMAIQGDWPLTRAERTDYRETSTLADVAAFLDGLKARGAPIGVQTIGQTAGGRPILLALASRPSSITPEQARAAGKVVVYVQANIHGGEVEGKEAAQALLRDVATNRDGASALLDRLVLLVCPVYNADGNEAFGDGAVLRPSQNGPARVGRRPNADAIDLNRDAVKAEAPETRAVLEQVYRAWEPDVVLDLHTTNGTRHGYVLTYSPPLNPNADPGVQTFARESLLPAVRARLKREHGWSTFDYGNVETRDGREAWYTFGQEGRYVTNYVGLRNRIGILSEAASFQPFRLRVESTLGFVRSVLDEVATRADEVIQITRKADRALAERTGVRARGVRFEFTPREGTEPIPLESLPEGVKADHRQAPDPSTLAVTPLPVFDRFRPTREATLPAAYLLPPKAEATLTLLTRHGIAVDRLDRPWKGTAQVFVIAERVTARQAFQGGRLTRLEGRFETRAVEAPAGWSLVRTSQPLGLLAFHLLEPESLDGAAAWGFLEGTFESPGDYPVWKLDSTAAPSVETLP